jgi:engulfment and cell motility protein 1
VRNALTLLVLLVSRPLAGGSDYAIAANTGFNAIKPALDAYPTFLESLVQRLSASDHTLCANALQLVNALMRDAVINGGENEWPKFIKRLQDLGVIGGVGMLMRGEAAGDTSSPLAGAILEFQGLTKILLRKWRGVKVNTELAEHKRALKTVHLLSKPEKYEPTLENTNEELNARKGSRRHHPEKWRRLGFETESPAWEFEETGYLGIMDLVDYARRNEDAYHKIFMEQAVQPHEQRCPLARASLGVTLVLYEHFEIEETAHLEAPQGFGHARVVSADRFDPRVNVDKLYRPLLLQWGRLHTASLNAFLRLWKLAGAELDDFYKIEELIRIIVERVIGSARRKTDVARVEEELRTVSLEAARKWQMDGLDEVYEDAWGPHLVQVREQLYHESLQFMKEQRIRCLLQGSWFPTIPGAGSNRDVTAAWRFARLSHNRRWLHYQDYSTKTTEDPKLDELTAKIDLNTVTSVDSNVSATEPAVLGALDAATSSTETLRDTNSLQRPAHLSQTQATTTKITILGASQYPPSTSNSSSSESPLLELYPHSPHLASEWLDGLLLLLNQQPITKSTTQLIDMMTEWGVRLRMLNLRWEDVDWEELERRVKGVEIEDREVPDREGVDDEFWFDVGGS